MKAIVQTRYGVPREVLSLSETETPRPRDNELLVEIHAASINALDWHATRGMPYLIRIGEGLRSPRNRIRGVDLAGRVVETGANVTRFKVGDEVFGGANGSFAEFAVTTEDRLAHVPTGFSHAEAAALHVAGMTALQGLLDKARVHDGQHVLVNGAGGGVGICAVQIAKALGAQVTGVTRTDTVELVRSLGADYVIDYQGVDFTRSNEKFDVIFDIGGNRSFADLRKVTSPEGMIIVVGAPAGRWLAPASRMLHAGIADRFAKQRIIPFISANDGPSLTRLASLASDGKIRPVIDKTFDLSMCADAISYVGGGKARGKVAVRVR